MLQRTNDHHLHKTLMWPAKDVLAALGADEKATSTGRDTHCARQRFMAM